MLIRQAILDVLNQMETDCATDEFAYLSATSKVEAPFRDRMAFNLHRRLAHTEAIVAREWTPKGSRKRIDIAILNGDATPHTLIELKAMYSFDALRGGENSLGTFEINVKKDMEKAVKVCAPNVPQVMGLLLACHVGTTIPEYLTRVVKYASDINDAYVRHGEKISEMVQEKAPRALAPLSIVRYGEILSGRVFKISPRVMYWLVEV